MHLALWILVGFSLLGAVVSAMRGSVDVPTEQVVAVLEPTRGPTDDAAVRPAA